MGRGSPSETLQVTTYTAQIILPPPTRWALSMQTKAASGNPMWWGQVLLCDLPTQQEFLSYFVCLWQDIHITQKFRVGLENSVNNFKNHHHFSILIKELDFCKP